MADIKSISIDSPEYPVRLKSILNPPGILYVRGNAELLYNPGVSIVGTRDCSKAGAEIAKRIAQYLVEHGYTIVSGLALGIDAAAHEGGIKSTIAVLAHGLHEAHPKANAGLAKRILDNGGAWVSEHPEGTSPNKNFFVPRNRIQVGLSIASVIVESELKSGTMTHANFALNENHLLFSVLPQTPENKLNLKYKGPEMLVKQKGAIPIRSKDDYEKILNKLDPIETYQANRL
ncbi:MAG: DNA-protecting protein DprA [Gammaproteobacteria bacterium]|nr:DNA-protecting protein DprA [Gammaproteobacteria bacterium]